jgi:DNA-binding NtrC family response regulator
MQDGILIVDEDRDCRKQMAEMLMEAGYEVTVSDSVASALYGVLKNTAQVVVLGSKFDELTAADIIPLLKQCNRKLSIILITADASLGLLRKLRCEGIFYHALKPVDAEGREEIRQAVHCAFNNQRFHPA